MTLQLNPSAPAIGRYESSHEVVELKPRGAVEGDAPREETFSSRVAQVPFLARFAVINLVGPDRSSAEWGALLKPIAGRIVVVDSTAASFPFLEHLSGPRRVVMTATDSAMQRFDTIFPEYFITSLTDPDLNCRQSYVLKKITRNGSWVVAQGMVAPSFTGKASMPNYSALRTQAITALPGGGQSFAGQADDPFFADLRVFDLLYGGNLSEVGQNTLAGYNVNTIALQVPRKDLALRNDNARNPIGRAYILGKIYMTYLSQPDMPVVTTRGRLGFKANPTGAADLSVGIDSAFKVVEDKMPECQQLMVDVGGLRSFHALVKDKEGRKPLAEIKLMKDDAAAVEKQAEEIKTRYTKYFKV